MPLSVSGTRSKPPATFRPLPRMLYLATVCPTAWVEPASTASIPARFACPWAYASMMDRPLVTSAFVATALKLMDLPESLNACWQPSMRGWMLSAPGVAMKSTTSPELTCFSARWPRAYPDSYNPWPMYANRFEPGSSRAPSALYDTTGMPASSAWSIGERNAFLSTTAMARPSALALIALLDALTISATMESFEPVHWNWVPSSFEASSAPYWVG